MTEKKVAVKKLDDESPSPQESSPSITTVNEAPKEELPYHMMLPTMPPGKVAGLIPPDRVDFYRTLGYDFIEDKKIAGPDGRCRHHGLIWMMIDEDRFQERKKRRREGYEKLRSIVEGEDETPAKLPSGHAFNIKRG